MAFSRSPPPTRFEPSIAHQAERLDLSMLWCPALSTIPMRSVAVSPPDNADAMPGVTAFGAKETGWNREVERISADRRQQARRSPTPIAVSPTRQFSGHHRRRDQGVPCRGPPRGVGQGRAGEEQRAFTESAWTVFDPRIRPASSGPNACRRRAFPTSKGCVAACSTIHAVKYQPPVAQDRRPAARLGVPVALPGSTTNARKAIGAPNRSYRNVCGSGSSHERPRAALLLTRVAGFGI
jgi:hypothetical protein